MRQATILAFAAIFLAACGGSGQAGDGGGEAGDNNPVSTAAPAPDQSCTRKTSGELTPGYQAEVDIACSMTLTDGVSIRFVENDSTDICRPFVVGIAPKGAEFRFLIDYDLDGKARKTAFRVSGNMLKERQSGAIYLGAMGATVETPCKQLDMTVTSATCGGGACEGLTFEGTDVFKSFSGP